MKQTGNSFSRAVNRRQFLKTATLAAGAAAWGVPTLLRAANLNGRLNLAVVGAMGKGQSDTDHCNTENIVALCDVDAKRCAPQRAKYPSAKFYQDYRQMFAEMSAGIDAVIVATPDHMHAMVASLAMKQGKHVYCQKPLVQTIYEARYLRQLAKSSGLVTQMGNQGSSADGLRRAVECIQAGIIGNVREIHVWTDRPIWAQGLSRPPGADPVPDWLNWDVWTGAAPMRPFKAGAYHPFAWRGWQDFGTGALGDMACHTVNLPFRALHLSDPAGIDATVLGEMNQETYPVGSRIRFEFPKRKLERPGAATLKFPAAALMWYDGGKPATGTPGGHDFSNRPPAELLTDVVALRGEVPKSGCLLIGDQGQIFSPDDYGEQFYVKRGDDAKFIHYKKYAPLAAIPQTIPRNDLPGDSDHKHHQEWIAAIKAGDPGKCYSRFEIGSQLTELVLLGCVSLRAGRKIEWDASAMRAKHYPQADPLIRRENRAGWELA